MSLHQHLQHHHPRRVTLLALALGLLSSSCDSDLFHLAGSTFGGPQGVISGRVTYSGPLPCTYGGDGILGAVVLLAFDERLLPSPEGLGTSAASVALITGEELFRGIRHQLAFSPDGSVLCPPAGTPPIVVSADFSIGPLTGATYQVRGYYDYDGNWDPAFSVFSLPTQGDIGGGAIQNAAEVLTGARPVFRSIALGEPADLDGDGAVDAHVIADDGPGAHVEGVSVTLAAPFAWDRPMYHIKDVRDEHFGNDNPDDIVVPADYELALFSTSPADVTASEASFIRLVIGAGFPVDKEGVAERELAAQNPFFFSTDDPKIMVTRQDVNLDGVLDGEDHISETTMVPALAPQAVLSKASDASVLASQTGPSVLLQGVTLLGGLLQTAISPPNLLDARDEYMVALRPLVLCLDVASFGQPGVALVTHMGDAAGNQLIEEACCSNPPECTQPAEPCALEQALSAKFNRPMSVMVGCLPRGQYRLNLVYDTGQAWTVPNEAGVCDVEEGELPVGNYECANEEPAVPRPRLPSQAVTIRIGAPVDPTYCEAFATPPQCLLIPAE